MSAHLQTDPPTPKYRIFQPLDPERANQPEEPDEVDRTTYTLGVDVGGTNVRAGLVDRDGKVHHRAQFATEALRGPEHVVGRITSLVGEVRQKSGIRPIAVGCGVPGPINYAEGVIENAPNLPGFKHFPIRERLLSALGVPVVLENDANAAAFGEYTAGAGLNYRAMVMLTLGTGVGGGMVLNDGLWRGVFGNAAEPGHIIIEHNGRPCPCGQRGCLERYGSASAIAERALEAVKGGEPSSLMAFLEAGRELTSRDVAEAAKAGDKLATRIWDEACRALAIVVITLQHVINPDVVVLAGGLINAGDQLLDLVRMHHRELVWKMADDHPRIELATLGGDAGIIGSAALARRTVEG